MLTSASRREKAPQLDVRFRARSKQWLESHEKTQALVTVALVLTFLFEHIRQNAI